MKPDFSELAEVRKRQFKQRMEKAQQEKDDLKNKLAEKYNVIGNPKLDLCFKLAWDYGHSAGEMEVDIYFSELVDLIKEDNK